MFIALWPVTAAAQSADPKVYAPVPEQLRARLRERLSQYLSCERARDYERLFDLFSEQEVVYLRKLGWAGKSEWVAFMRPNDGLMPTTLSFTPTLIKKRRKNEFVVFGRLESEHAQRVDVGEGSIRAYWENGDWYFSELGVEIDV